MRALIVLLALLVTPFVAGMAQSPNGSRCDNGQGDEHRSAQGQAHAHRGQCNQPPPPPLPPPPTSSCPVTALLNLGTTEIDGTVMDGNTYVGLANWCIRLSGTVSAVVTTDASGNYAFTGLPGGTYTVCEVLPSGWTEVFPDASFGTPCATGYGWTFNLAAGDIGSFVNFMNTQP